LAVVAGVVTVAMTVLMARRGAFAARVNPEVRKETDAARAAFLVTAAGRPVAANVQLEYPDGKQHLRAADGELPAFRSLRRLRFDACTEGREPTVARELKIWAHRITAEHDSQSLPAHLRVQLGEEAEARQFDPELSHGQIVLPLTDPSWRVDIALAERR
jgi:hypothetical protein